MCDACWFKEYVNSAGIGHVVDGLEVPVGDARVRLTGRMVSEHTNNTNGEDWDEDFEVDDVKVTWCLKRGNR